MSELQNESSVFINDIQDILQQTMPSMFSETADSKVVTMQNESCSNSSGIGLGLSYNDESLGGDEMNLQWGALYDDKPEQVQVRNAVMLQYGVGGAVPVGFPASQGADDSDAKDELDFRGRILRPRPIRLISPQHISVQSENIFQQLGSLNHGNDSSPIADFTMPDSPSSITSDISSLPAIQQITQQQLEKNKRNAVMAKQNREKKKAEVKQLQEQNQRLRQAVRQLQMQHVNDMKRSEELEDEVEYLRKVLENESILAKYLDTLKTNLDVNVVGLGKRKATLTGDNTGSKRKKSDVGGVCIHINGGKASVEACFQCALKSAQR